MTFDSNGDGKVATAELSERMQVIVPRGDTSGDGALDDSELRALTARRMEFVSLALQNRQSFGGYGFGDSVGLLSTRSHIQNTIDDLRLTPEANAEARRIASTFVDQLEDTARLKLRGALAPMLTEQQFVELERILMAPGAGRRPILPGEIEIPCGFCRVTSSDSTSAQTFAVATARTLLERYQLTPDQIRAATVALESFKPTSSSMRRAVRRSSPNSRTSSPTRKATTSAPRWRGVPLSKRREASAESSAQSPLGLRRVQSDSRRPTRHPLPAENIEQGLPRATSTPRGGRIRDSHEDHEEFSQKLRAFVAKGAVVTRLTFAVTAVALAVLSAVTQAGPSVFPTGTTIYDPARRGAASPCSRRCRDSGGRAST
jgi:hypothetical protein